MTIAGQTALGDGIVIKGYGIGFSGRNVIIRHMRFRPGDVYTVVGQEQSCLWYENASDFIIDHCSFSWAVEESMTIYDNERTTVQYSLVSESLNVSVHDKGSRGYGAQWGGKTASYHHNFLAHHQSRMPRQNGARSNAGGTDKGVCIFDYVNNVHYNWGANNAFYGGDARALSGNRVDCNIINNYYIPGPSTTATPGNQYFVAPSTPEAPGQIGKWWLEGNVMWNNNDKTDNNMSKGIMSNTNSQFSAAGKFSIPTDFAIAATTAEVARDTVFANVGATLPKRDALDARIIGEAKDRMAGGTGYTFKGSASGKSGIIDSQTDTKPANADASWDAWGSYYAQVDSTHAPLDTDGDGMPDTWELQMGLDPSNPADGSYRDFSDYTNLECYLNKDDAQMSGELKTRQHISWEQDTIAALNEPNIVLTATTNGGLPISYSSSDEDMLRVVNGNELEIGGFLGKVTITATQAGNAEYARARPVSKVFTVLAIRPQTPPTTTDVGQVNQVPVRVYPNPVDDLLNLSFESEGAYSISLSDMNGVVVYKAKSGGASHTIDVSSYASGAYLLSIENAQKKRTVVKVMVR